MRNAECRNRLARPGCEPASRKHDPHITASACSQASTRAVNIAHQGCRSRPARRAATNSITNTASKAAFTIATASSLAVNGAGLHSASAKGATTGVLASATKFSATRTLFNADVFTLAYTITLTSA